MQLLALRPLRRYITGEVVAYQRTASAPTAAAAAAERRAHEHTAYSRDQHHGANDIQPVVVAGAPEGSSMLCYGLVAAACGPIEGHALYRIPVETDPGVVTQLLSSQVFCFKAAPAGASMQAAAGAAAEALPSSGTSPVPNQHASAPAAGGPSTGAVTPLTIGPNNSTAATAAGASSAGVSAAAPVSPAELVGAVRSLLAGAGLSLEGGHAAALARVTELQAALSTATGQLNQVCSCICVYVFYYLAGV